MEYDASVEKDELNKILLQEFAIKDEEAIDAQKHVFARETREELRRHEQPTCTLGSKLESELQNQSWESST